VIFIILGGILSGVFTATESAATAVLWALLVTTLLYRSLVAREFPQGLCQSLQDHRRGAAADRYFRRFRLFHGAVRGAAEALFGGVAGSPLADVSAMGSVMIPLMKKEGYHADYAVNVTTHAALVGALMPTSHNIIIFTLATTGIASVSVLGLIVACLILALILTLCNLAAAYFVAVKRGYPTRGGFAGWHVQPTTLLMPRPPRTCPTRLLAKRTDAIGDAAVQHQLTGENEKRDGQERKHLHAAHHLLEHHRRRQPRRQDGCNR
jgi:TRAP-type C4-dicarboxylate transport system permease large subunit